MSWRTESLPSRSFPLRWILILGAIVVGVFVIFGVRTVDTREVGFITSQGEYKRTVDTGLVFKWPWQKLTTMKIGIQKEDADVAAASSDINDVFAKLALNYRIASEDDALWIFQNIGSGYKNNVLEPALQESFKATSAQFTNEELIQQRAQVKAVAVADLTARLAKYHIGVVDVSLVNFDFSKEVKDSINQRTVAQQNVLKAEADARARTAEAQGRLDSARLDAQAQKALQESLTPELLQKMYIEKWDGHLPTYQTGSGTDLLLNLAK